MQCHQEVEQRMIEYKALGLNSSLKEFAGDEICLCVMKCTHLPHSPINEKCAN